MGLIDRQRYENFNKIDFSYIAYASDIIEPVKEGTQPIFYAVWDLKILETLPVDDLIR